MFEDRKNMSKTTKTNGFRSSMRDLLQLSGRVMRVIFGNKNMSNAPLGRVVRRKNHLALEIEPMAI